jgi:hypothetical protein
MADTESVENHENNLDIHMITQAYAVTEKFSVCSSVLLWFRVSVVSVCCLSERVSCILTL